MTATPPDSPSSKPPWSTIYFRLEAPEAARVCLAGDFNAWDAERHCLHKNPNGVWECQVPLPPGRYGYHFVVDGLPRPDPRCAIRERRPDGTPCCVVDVAAPGGSCASA